MHWTGPCEVGAAILDQKKDESSPEEEASPWVRKKVAPIFLRDLTCVTFSSLSGGYCQPTVPVSILTPQGKTVRNRCRG